MKINKKEKGNDYKRFTFFGLRKNFPGKSFKNSFNRNVFCRGFASQDSETQMNFGLVKLLRTKKQLNDFIAPEEKDELNSTESLPVTDSPSPAARVAQEEETISTIPSSSQKELNALTTSPDSNLEGSKNIQFPSSKPTNNVVSNLLPQKVPTQVEDPVSSSSKKKEEEPPIIPQPDSSLNSSPSFPREATPFLKRGKSNYSFIRSGA